MLLDDKVFTRIQVPAQDCVAQTDIINCGVYLLLCLQEMSLLHTWNYKSKSDFVTVPMSNDVSFKVGDFFSLYFPPNKKRAREPGYTYLSVAEGMLNAFREQTLCLCNRILTLKSRIDKKNEEKGNHHSHHTITEPSWLVSPEFEKACLEN